MKGVDSMNIALSVSGLTICLIALVMTVSSTYLEQRTRRYFITIFSILTVYVLLCLLEQAASETSDPSWVVVSRSALFWESLLPSVLTVIITSFLLDQSGEREWWRNRIFHMAFLMWAVYLAFLIYTQFTEVFYFIDDDNVYERGPYYPLLLAPLLLVMALNLTALWQKRKKLHPHSQLSR